MKKFKVGSFFAGVGGICLGFLQAKTEKAGYELVFANEIDSYACKTYQTNFSHTLLEGDILSILHPENSLDMKYYYTLHEKLFSQPIDILTGGFPCQAFSVAGQQKGFADSRGNLFLSFIDFIQQMDKKFHKKPRILFLENVKNLKNHDEGKTYQVIKSKLKECGYIIKDVILNTKDFSYIPQNRERIYIIGFLEKKDADRFTMFNHLNDYKVNLTAAERKETVKDLLDFTVSNEKYFYTAKKYPIYFEDKNKPLSDRKAHINLLDKITEKFEFYQLRRGLYVRKNKSHVCPTLTANMGTGGHNVPLILTDKGIRKLTPAETFKLQGFPIGNGYILPVEYNGKPYADCHLYKQAGNAVSVPIITLLAKEILKACKEV